MMLSGSGRLDKVLLTCSGFTLALMISMGPAAAAHHRHHGGGRHGNAGHAHHHHLHKHGRVGRAGRHGRHASAANGGYSPPFAEMAVDANTGRTLVAVNENQERHPASLTKVMTLYLLFEQMQKGRMGPGTEITVSAHAASMEPDKLGLRPGSHIAIDSAVKAIVTKSANDMAVAIAESIGGTESHFAELMTAKAHELGMAGTNYVNASGLPDDEQLTTAHDMIILGRAIQERFPEYYRYFSTPNFTYAGSYMHNHDHLLGKVEGVDGIKTGYTRASGYNLLTSVHRGGRHLVAAILGGRSWRSRDLQMEQLIADNFDKTSTHRGAYAEAEPAPAPQPAQVAEVEPLRPVVEQRAAPAPYVFAEKIRPAFVASAPKAVSDETPVTDTIPAVGTGAVVSATTSGSSTTPTPLRWVTGPQPVHLKAREIVAHDASSSHDAASAPAHSVTLAKLEPRRAAAVDEAPASRHAGIQIQIGATDDVSMANDLLSRAKSSGHRALAGATPYTQKVQKGRSVLYRARFAGLDPSQAEAACRDLKRSGFACFTIKD